MPDADKKSRASARPMAATRTPGHGLSGSAVESDKQAAQRYRRERNEAREEKRDLRDRVKALQAALNDQAAQWAAEVQERATHTHTPT